MGGFQNMDNKQDGAVFCRIEMSKFKIVKLQYKRYLKNIRPESKKYTGQIFILKKLSSPRWWKLAVRVEYREARIESISSK